MASSTYASKGISGIGQGAMTGAAIGSVVPGMGTGVGAAIGGATGLIGGLFSAWSEEEDARRREEIIKEAAAQLNLDYREIEQAFTDFYNNYNLAEAYGFTDANGKVDMSKLGEAAEKIKNWDAQVNKRLVDSGQAEIDPYTGELKLKSTSFDYDKEIKDFVDPYMGNVIKNATDAVQHSAAGAGLGRSTGAAQAIAETAAKTYDQIYNTGLDKYNQDRSQAYNEWAKEYELQNNRFNTLLEADKWGITAQQGLADAVINQQGEKAQNLANLKQDQANTRAQVTLSKL